MSKLFHDRVTKLAKIAEKSLNQIERELGIPRNALNNYRKGGDPSSSRLIDLADYFNVSPKFLLGESDDILPMPIDKFFHSLKANEKLEMCSLCKKWLEGEFEIILKD